MLSDKRLSKKRLFVIFSFFILALLGLLLRLGFLQIFNSSKLLSLAQNQSRAVIEMQPARGKILDRNGSELALDVRLDSLYAVAREIKEKESTADKLHKILGSSRDELLKRIRRDKLFVWLARKLPVAKSEAVKSLKIDGLEFVKESMRVYPKGKTACQIVGFTDIDNNGLEGVELQYNSFLKGVPGWRLSQKDAKQRELISKQLEMVPPVDGYSIHLSIDEVIQSIAERELAATCKKHNALGGSVIVMDPKTGDILAMANYPDYDLNHSNRSTPESRRNRAITDLHEPGSVFKAFTLAAIVEDKTFNLNEKFDCERGSWSVAGRVLHDHRGSGILTYRQVIEKSSNIGTVKGAMRLGGDKLYKMIKAFGFGQRTGIPLAGEISGIVPHPKSWSRSSIINIPIGHGVATTPIQLASALSAIANNGVLMKPRIITRIDDQDGRPIQSNEPEVVRRVISKESAIEVRTVLEGVVSNGTGKKAAVPGFKAAGKTGTAQKILPDGTYSHDHFIASFIGFVPYDEPKLVITVNVDEPHPVYFGGEVSAPCFSRIASQILSYWEISQTQSPPEVIKKGSKKVSKPAPKKPLTQPVRQVAPQSGARAAA